jgi:hypothetical protein
MPQAGRCGSGNDCPDGTICNTMSNRCE